METLQLSKLGIEECAARAADVLRAGGVVLYPTDTLYGLGADALSDEAVSKVFAIKGRDAAKPIHCIVGNMTMAKRYGVFGAEAELLAKTFWPGPLTLVVPKKVNIHSGIARGIDTIGFRVPKHEFCAALAHSFGSPYTTTSANRSEKESPRTLASILAQLHESVELIDLAIDAGELPLSLPSTVVRVGNGSASIIREGRIPAYEIFEALGNSPREHEGTE